MTEEILDSDILLKDTNRETNAGLKLTTPSRNLKFSFDTKAVPSMVCGVEENPVLSTVDLISCLRDALGNIRLCVDSAGLYQANSQQTYITINSISAISGDTIYTVPNGKTLYILGLCWGNQQGAFSNKMGMTIDGNYNCLAVVRQGESVTMSGGVVLAVAQNKTINLYVEHQGVSTEFTYCIWGYLQ